MCHVKRARHAANQPLLDSHGGAYPLFRDDDDDDDDDGKLAQEASRRAGSSGNPDMFASVLGMLGNRKAAAPTNTEIDEDCTFVVLFAS